jgi:hypothetical protein
MLIRELWILDGQKTTITGKNNRNQSIITCTGSLSPNYHKVIQMDLDNTCWCYRLHYSRKKPQFRKSKWPVGPSAPGPRERHYIYYFWFAVKSIICSRCRHYLYLLRLFGLHSLTDEVQYNQSVSFLSKHTETKNSQR